ncbi:hypothetical protein KP509_16G014800 [Ceratopteris richardii]|uniref:Uncharacterized protein n=1 Tax=Ceratopteris richardii TaxID=49495 RepID=A0A8T2T2G8_CERRI|nr:hypothetical protein KP509_16G014800 [Ceratopteris richardii]
MDETRPDAHYEDQEFRRRSLFQKRLHRAKTMALTTALLYPVLNILDFLWSAKATLLLTRGIEFTVPTQTGAASFESTHSEWDFYLVTGVLIAHGVRLRSVEAWKKVFSDDGDDENACFRALPHFCNRRLSVFANITTFISLVLRLYHIDYRRAHPFSGPDPRDLMGSLFILYILEITLCCIHFVYLTVTDFVGLSHMMKNVIDEDSIVSLYFMEIFKEAVARGRTKAKEMDLTELGFRTIAASMMRGSNPLAVRQYSERLNGYIYSQPGSVRRVCEYLKSEKLWLRAAAGSLPGFWATQRRITFQKDLFWRLRKVMHGGDKDAECAIRSVQFLAAHWIDNRVDLKQEYPFLVDDPVAGTNIVDTLVNVVSQRIRPTLSFQVKALAACCRHHLVLEYFYQKLDLELVHERGHSERPIPKEEVGKMLHELAISATVHMLGGDRSSSANDTAEPEGRNDNSQEDDSKELILRSRLGHLCMKLCEIIGPTNRNICFITKIYASEALVRLLLHGRSPIEDDRRRVFEDMVNSIMAPERRDSQKVELEDVKAMERVRQLLSVDEFPGWNQFQVSGIDDDRHNFVDELALAVVRRKVEDVRRDSVRH